MVSEVSKLVLQGLETVYTPLKDSVLYMKGRPKYVIEVNLLQIVAGLGKFYLLKDQIDQTLEVNLSKEKSGLYNALITQFEVFEKRSYEYINKYQRLCKNLPNSEAHDLKSAIHVTEALKERNPTRRLAKLSRKTSELLELSRKTKTSELLELSRKISELLVDISKVIVKMEHDVLSYNKIEAVEVKHDEIDLDSSTKYVKKNFRYVSDDDDDDISSQFQEDGKKWEEAKDMLARRRHEKMPIGETNDPPETASRCHDGQSVDDIVFGRVGESELGITFRILLVGRNMSEHAGIIRLRISSMSSTQTQEEETDFGLRPDMDNYHFFSTREAAVELKEHGGIVTRNGKEMPTAEDWRRARVVNLIERKVVPIPKEEEPNCPNLLILFLQRNSRLTHIPQSFFSRMRRLHFLDLSDTRITALPSSLFELRNLQVLLLRSCVCLDTLPAEVGNLTNLEVLDLLGTDLPDLPKEMRALTKLRHLQISFHQPDYGNSESELVSSRPISELQALQGLSISVHTKDQQWARIVVDVINQVGKLKMLSYLQFYFPSVEALLQFCQLSVSWREKRLRRFSFVVGQNIKRIISRVPEEVEREYEKYDQCLRLVNSGNKEPELIKRILQSVTAFYMDHHLEIQSLSEFGVSTFAELKFCVLRECANVQVVFMGGKRDASFFPKLEYLGLHYLWNLERIWKDDRKPGSYEALKYLEISTCGKLEYVASHSVFQCLFNLETFIIEDCESLRSIVKEEATVKGAAAAALLPRLKKLRLCHLPQLDALGRGLFPSEDIIDVECCPKLKIPPIREWKRSWAYVTTGRLLRFLPRL